MNTVQKLLVPVDLSERCAEGLQYAASLAQETKAEIIVLHVFGKNERGSFMEPFTAFEGWPIPPNFRTRIPIDIRFRDKSSDLHNFIQKVIGSPDHLRIRRRVKIGNPVKEIIQVAKEESVDLIVLAMQKKSLFSYLMSRVTLLRLTWRFPCPVLLTPPIKGEKDHGETDLGSSEETRPYFGL